MRGTESDIIQIRRMIKTCGDIIGILEMYDYVKAEYDNDIRFGLSCGMCITILGECESRISGEFKEAHGNIPWHATKSMRNIFAHNYDRINTDIVWETITERIPELRTQLSEILNELTDQ